MSERSMRGSRLGAISYENERNIELAPRHLVTYECERGHRTEIPMALDAHPPGTWECSRCPAVAQLAGREATPDFVRPQRTHWDMLIERRTTAQLEDVLAERLTLLRDAGPLPTQAPAADPTKSSRYGRVRRSA